VDRAERHLEKIRQHIVTFAMTRKGIEGLDELLAEEAQPAPGTLRPLRDKPSLLTA
jgi:hypothetical protein